MSVSVSGNADIVFMLDITKSLTTPQFNTAVQLVIKIMQMFNVDSSNFHQGFVTVTDRTSKVKCCHGHLIMQHKINPGHLFISFINHA